VNLGFDPNGLAVLNLNAPASGYAGTAQSAALGREVVSRVANLPGVVSASITSKRPVSFNGNTTWIRFVGRPYHGEHNEVLQRDVSTGYFATLRASLLRGRSFTERDVATAPPVAIINQTLANKYFPGEDPIGRRIGDTQLSPASLTEIVGIVEDIREGPLDAEIWPAVYYPFGQSPDTSFAIVVRSSMGAAALGPVRAAIHAIDPDIGSAGETTMNDSISDSPTAYLHFSAAWLVGAFAAMALMLGGVGLYGVIAYSVSQRTRELGIRIALGAQRSSVYRLILGEAGRLAAAGIAVGLACSIWLATLMRNLLFGTPPWDLPTLVAVAALLAGSAALASYVPARRAARLDPAEALRRDG
jgi:predicted permease